MIFAIIKAMYLRLWRDKGALILAFVLPGAIFAVFAVIFSTASGGALDLRVSFAVESQDAHIIDLSEIFEKTASFDIITNPNWRSDDVKMSVRLGEADIGIVLSHDEDLSPKWIIFEDPSRKVATPVLKGQIRQLLASYNKSPQNMGVIGDKETNIFTTLSALPETHKTGQKSDKSVTYYIGATAILFLMFAAMQGASISIDERKSGLSQRLMVGPKGTFLMLAGKFIFLTLIGFLQVAAIIVVAVIFFHVTITPYLLALFFIMMATAMISASLALFVAALCSSQSQMHTISTFIVLIFSAIGGSMIPRFMMPAWLQNLGIITPNYWAIEGFYGILARDQSIVSLWPVWSVMFGGAILLFLLAGIISHKLMRL